MTDDPDIRIASSIIDYVFRRLALDYLDFDERAELGIYTAAERARYVETGSYASDEEEGGLIDSETLKDRPRPGARGRCQPARALRCSGGC